MIESLFDLTTILTTAISVFSAFAAYYYFQLCQKPMIYTSNITLQKFLENHVKVLEEKYWPVPLYFDGRLQTVIGVFQRRTIPFFLPYTREIFTLADGGQLALDHLEPKEPIKGPRLVVLLLPGLTSCSQECYMKTLSLIMTKVGATVVAMNNRGMGGVPIKTPKMFSASSCDDATEVITHVKKQFPKDRLMAIGVSMGGMNLANYIIKHPEQAKETLTAAMVISILWNPVDGLLNLEKGFLNKYVVNYGITRRLLFYARKFRKDIETFENHCWNFDKLLASRTVGEFDDSFTGPQFGVERAVDYYKHSTVQGETHNFPIPVFALSACDDPLQPETCIPINEAEARGSNLALIVTRYGGHVGFLEGVLPRKKSVHYLERVVSQIVQAVRMNGNDLKLNVINNK